MMAVSLILEEDHETSFVHGRFLPHPVFFLMQFHIYFFIFLAPAARGSNPAGNSLTLILNLTLN